MKKIIIICVIFLMIAGAAIAVLQWLNIGPFSDTAPVSEGLSNQTQVKVQIFVQEQILI